jgi:hypothetical protein
MLTVSNGPLSVLCAGVQCKDVVPFTQMLLKIDQGQAGSVPATLQPLTPFKFDCR